jgi:hypothetical protein
MVSRRMTTMALVAALAASGAEATSETTAPPSGTGAWRSARWGMTPEEVLAALPKEAVRLSPEVKLADGNVVAVGIDGYPFEGLTFDVRFVFAAGKLALVSLRTPQKQPVEAAAYTRLRDALTKAWGPPLEETKDDNFVDLRQARWNRGPDRADLKYIPGVVVLVHYPRPAS